MNDEGEVYEVIANALMRAAGDDWDEVVFKTAILFRNCSSMTVSKKGRYGRLPVDLSGSDLRLINSACVALRDSNIGVGARIWGMICTVTSDGRFKIEYSYDRPGSYTQADQDEDEMALRESEKINNSSPAERGEGGDMHAKAIEAALAWLRGATFKHSTQWGLGKEANWNLDLNAGQLRWTFSDGRIVHADIQVIGTFNTKNDSFLWGWEHPSVPQPLRRAAIAAQAWGEANGVADFTIRNPHCSEDRTWVFAAIAAQQDGASGVYRGNANGTGVYVAFSEPEQGSCA